MGTDARAPAPRRVSALVTVTDVLRTCPKTGRRPAGGLTGRGRRGGSSRPRSGEVSRRQSRQSCEPKKPSLAAVLERRAGPAARGRRRRRPIFRSRRACCAVGGLLEQATLSAYTGTASLGLWARIDRGALAAALRRVQQGLDAGASAAGTGGRHRRGGDHGREIDRRVGLARALGGRVRGARLRCGSARMVCAATSVGRARRSRPVLQHPLVAASVMNRPQVTSTSRPTATMASTRGRSRSCAN